MRNFKNNRRRFRNNSFDRHLKINSKDQNLNSSLGNITEIKKRNHPRGNFNSSKLIQKYSDLAREALSSGDKILYENYLQHAEHFIRISESTPNSNFDKNNSKGLNQVELDKATEQEVTKDSSLQIKEN